MSLAIHRNWTQFAWVRLLSVGGVLLVLSQLDGLLAGQNDFVKRLIILAGLYVVLAVSLNLINGITGQFSMGHAAFYMVGAYTAGYLASTQFTRLNLPLTLWMPLVMVAGAIAAAIAGLIVGLPSLRLRGDYLAIVTLGFGEILRIVANNSTELGKAFGLNVSPNFRSIGLTWGLAILCVACCRNLLKTSRGLQFLAVREDEIASAAMGVPVTRTKVLAFVVGSAFAGAAGAVLAHFEGFVSTAMFSMDVSFILVTMVVLGGTGSITGSVIAAVLLFYIPEAMRELPDTPMARILGAPIAIVALLRREQERFHGPARQKWARNLGIVLGCVVLAIALGAVLANLPGMNTMVQGSKLRMVVFAITLIALMLLRPQGILAHHELSWDWVQRLRGKPAPTHEVSA